MALFPVAVLRKMWFKRQKVKKHFFTTSSFQSHIFPDFLKKLFKKFLKHVFDGVLGSIFYCLLFTYKKKNKIFTRCKTSITSMLVLITNQYIFILIKAQKEFRNNYRSNTQHTFQKVTSVIHNSVYLTKIFQTQETPIKFY